MTIRKSFFAGGALVLAGAILGAIAFRPDSSAAQSSPQLSECFFARQETVDTNNSGNISRPGANRLVRIPPGWSVQGGGAYAGGGVVLLCR